MLKLDAAPPPNSFVDPETGKRMIPVDLGDGQIVVMDEAQLYKRWGVDEDDRAQTHWIEYWLEAPCGEPDYSKRVHRSVHVFVKKALEFSAEQGALNG